MLLVCLGGCSEDETGFIRVIQVRRKGGVDGGMHILGSAYALIEGQLYWSLVDLKVEGHAARGFQD